MTVSALVCTPKPSNNTTGVCKRAAVRRLQCGACAAMYSPSPKPWQYALLHQGCTVPPEHNPTSPRPVGRPTHKNTPCHAGLRILSTVG